MLPSRRSAGQGEQAAARRARAHRPGRRRPSPRSCSGTTTAISFGVVRADNFALFFNVILIVVGLLTILFSGDVIEREELPAGEYYTLLLFSIAGMMLMASATDLLVIFLALEILSLGVYVLTGHPAQQPGRAPRAASSTSCSARSRARSSSTASR